MTGKRQDTAFSRAIFILFQTHLLVCHCEKRSGPEHGEGMRSWIPHFVRTGSAIFFFTTRLPHSLIIQSNTLCVCIGIGSSSPRLLFLSPCLRRGIIAAGSFRTSCPSPLFARTIGGRGDGLFSAPCSFAGHSGPCVPVQAARRCDRASPAVFPARHPHARSRCARRPPSFRTGSP